MKTSAQLKSENESQTPSKSVNGQYWADRSMFRQNGLFWIWGALWHHKHLHKHTSCSHHRPRPPFSHLTANTWSQMRVSCCFKSIWKLEFTKQHFPLNSPFTSVYRCQKDPSVRNKWRVYHNGLPDHVWGFCIVNEAQCHGESQRDICWERMLHLEMTFFNIMSLTWRWGALILFPKQWR